MGWIRALVPLALAIGPAGCLLAVSTSGLAGDPLDAAPEAVAADAPIDTRSPDEVGTDARDAFVPPDGSTVFAGNGHAYLIVVEPSGIGWPAARDLAVSMGGHLATIADANENAFVLDLLNAHPEAVGAYSVGPWLGAYQPTGSSEPLGGWTWVDGSPFLYAYWAVDQPDDANRTENYLDWYGFAWNDDSISGTATPVISLVVEFE